MQIKSIDRLKKQAKQLKREMGCTHAQALHALAHAHGYASWPALINARHSEPLTQGGTQ